MQKQRKKLFIPSMIQTTELMIVSCTTLFHRCRRRRRLMYAYRYMCHLKQREPKKHRQHQLSKVYGVIIAKNKKFFLCFCTAQNNNNNNNMYKDNI